MAQSFNNQNKGAQNYRDSSRYTSQKKRSRTSPHYSASGQDQIRAYNDHARYAKNRNSHRNSSPLKAVLATAILLVLVGVGGFLFFQTLPIEVTVNGTTQQLGGDKNINTIVEEKYATPKPGNFVDVEGELLEEGKGETLLAKVNGTVTTDLEAKLSQGDSIEIEDGGNITESSQDAIEEIPWKFSVEGSGPIHVISGGVNGINTTKVGDVSGKTITEETQAVENKVCKKYYPDTGDEKVIALTIDDGPWPGTTEEVLDILDEYNVKATFFTVGNLIVNNPELVKRMDDSGHQVCTHSWDHADGSGQGVNLGYMTEEEQREEIQKGYEAITAITGKEASRVIRTPGGNYSEESMLILEDLIDAEIGWSIDTEDWRLQGADAIVSQMKSARSGDIILCHDGGGDRSQTVEALRTAIPYLIEQGYTFVTMDEMLKFPAKESGA